MSRGLGGKIWILSPGSTVYLGRFLNSSVLPYNLQKRSQVEGTGG